MNLMSKLSKKGVTLFELLAVIVVLGIISIVAVVTIGNLLDRTRLKADQKSIINLNIATRYYGLESNRELIFDVTKPDTDKILVLVEEGFLSVFVSPQSKDAHFMWDEVLKSWFLIINNEIISLSPYGNTHLEITPHIISDIQTFYQENNRYARTWGDYRYTDLGLDPTLWKEPILHILYTPSGSNLFLKPEEGFQFSVWNSKGDLFFMRSSFNWNLIYNDLDGKWYFHRILAENEIDITTLVVEKS
jgi:prepilin-type N-terminal cleavage/methylation domain-containing protein